MKKTFSIFSGQYREMTCYNIIGKKRRGCPLPAGINLIVFMLMVLLMFPGAPAYGKSTTWNKTAGGSWTVAGNWTNGVPAANDDVIINKDQTSPITSVPSITLNSLTISGNCNLRPATGATDPVITIGTSLTVSAGKTLTLGATTGIRSLDLTISSTATGTINGKVTLNGSGALFTNSGILTLPPSVVIDGNGSFTLSTGATLYVGSADGIATTGATGNIQVTGTRTFSYGANYIYNNGTTAQVAGTGLTQSAAATLTVNNSAGLSLSTTTGISGLLSLTSGNLDMANFNLTIGSISGTGNISNLSGTPASPRIIVGSDNTSPAPYSGVISNGNASSVSVTKIGSGTFTLSGANTFSGLLTIGEGTLQLGASEVMAAPPVLLNGGALSTGATTGYSETLGTLTLSANSTIALGSGSHTLRFAESSSASWTGSTTLRISGWQGNWDGTSGSQGKIFIGNSSSGLTTTQLGQIVFVDVNDAEFDATLLSTGELVPSTGIVPQPGSDSLTFTSSGSWTAPACITSVTVQAWGAGGGGSTITGIGIHGGGGGGGAYASGIVSVTPGTTYNIVVGTGGAASTAGGKSSFNGTLIVAAGGSGGTNNSATGGAGGTVAASTGTTRYAGGNGANGGTTSSGGGGGGAGTTGAGGNASGMTGGTGKSLNGGTGGMGVSGSRNGKTGNIYGGGGSGAITNTPTDRIGGSGANGLVKISYSYTPPSITPGPDPTVCQGETTASISYSNAVSCPDLYAIDYNSTAQGQGFVDVPYTTLPANAITLAIPSAAVPGTYSGTLVVKSSATGLISTAYTIHITLLVNSWVGGTTGALNDWNTASNWGCGAVPKAGSDVTITTSATYQPVISGSTTALCRTLTINSGASVTVTSTGKATVTTINNNGTLNLNSDASGTASLMLNTYSGSSGAANIQLFLTGGGGPNYNWHYVAVPVDGLPKTYFTDINPYNLMMYNDARVVTSDFNGWSYHDGYGGTPGIAAGGEFSTLYYGKGYNFYNGTDATVNFANMTSIGNTFGTVSLQYSGTTEGSTIFGYNLLGNSLTCSLDWDKVTFSGQVEQTVYYTSANKWATYNASAGGTNGATKDIPPLQGFFVKANATGASVNLSSAREHSGQIRYKKSGTSEKEESKIIFPKVKIELNGDETSDETMVWFNSEATGGFDAKFDGHKIFSSENYFGELYSLSGENSYSINGIPLPSDSTIVPLGIRLMKAGSYSLLKKDLIPPDGFNVFLVDKANGNYTVNLEQTEKYSFASDAGTFNDRFLLKFISTGTVNTEQPGINSKFNIYATAGFINVMPPDNLNSYSEGNIRIYDLTGKVVKQVNNVGLSRMNLVQIPFTGAQGIYIVEISSGLTRFTGKVVVRQY